MMRSTVSASSLKNIQAYAQKKTTSVSLQHLFEYGVRPDADQKLRNAHFLHRELRIRLAQRIVELKRLPFGLSETRSLRQVHSLFVGYFDLLHSSPRPSCAKSEQEFTGLLRNILQDHAAVVQDVALGVIEMRQSYQGGRRSEFDMQMARTVDSYLNRFFMARIGLRFLIEHHITSGVAMSVASGATRPAAPRASSMAEGADGGIVSGIIESQCRPLTVAEWAAEDARHLCMHHFGMTPNVVLHGDPDVSFTYVPGHLQYILTELLKNALRATVEAHTDDEGELLHGHDALPDVQVVVARGEHDVTVKVSDQGGGIPYYYVPRVWTYLHSTAHSPRSRAKAGLSADASSSSSSVDAGTQGQMELLQQYSSGVGGGGGGGAAGQSAAALAGYGFGLPLSKLYAEYFGGHLDIKSMEGFGTDAYCTLNRLGTNCENLPQGVRASPAERDSTIENGD